MLKTGLEVLRHSGFAALRRLRVGLLTNPSGVDLNLNPTYHILWRAPEVNLVALFAPEHGFAAAAPDAAPIGTYKDPRTGLTVHSLYGQHMTPTAQMLQNVDVVVCDLQDVGARFYTYGWTISHILEAAAAKGIEVVILDRPNPLDGETIAGPLMEPALASFVGRYPIPVQYGLTMGELTQMINQTWTPTPARLTVIPMSGWSRRATWAQVGRVWIPPSPNMPHYSTVQHYPGACLIEGTNLSEGRGTALPFEITGAPWIDGEALAAELNAQQWRGIRFRAHTFQPTASKWTGQTCGGVQAHITDADAFTPLPTWLGVIATVQRMYPERFDWLPPLAAGVEPGGVHHFDRLIGTEQVRHALDAGTPVAEIIAGWGEDEAAFRQQRQPFLLYT